MSGGHFGPSIKYRLEEINDELQRIIDINDSDERDEHGDLKSRQLSDETLNVFKAVMVQNEFTGKIFKAVDYLLSGDIGERTLQKNFVEAAIALEKKVNIL